MTMKLNAFLNDEKTTIDEFVAKHDTAMERAYLDFMIVKAFGGDFYLRNAQYINRFMRTYWISDREFMPSQLANKWNEFGLNGFGRINTNDLESFPLSGLYPGRRDMMISITVMADTVPKLESVVQWGAKAQSASMYLGQNIYWGKYFSYDLYNQKKVYSTPDNPFADFFEELIALIRDMAEEKGIVLKPLPKNIGDFYNPKHTSCVVIQWKVDPARFAGVQPPTTLNPEPKDLPKILTR